MGSNVALVREREKKRHLDGSSSRSHHSKKFKESMTCLNSEGVLLAVKAGSESRARVIVDPGLRGKSVGGGLVFLRIMLIRYMYLFI